MADYVVRPFDVLYFRGNKSFDFGEWYSEGVFPPYPSTFQGFVRTAILKKNNKINSDGSLTNENKAKKLVGDDGNFPFDLIGPFVLDREFYMPMPLDAVYDDGTLKQITLSKETYETDLGFKIHYADLPPKTQFGSYEFSLVSMVEFNQYRKKLSTNLKIDYPIFSEPHVGISLEREERKIKLAKEGLFYLTPYQRFSESAGLYFAITSTNNIDISKLHGIYGKLGSEGKGATIENCSSQLNIEFQDKNFYKELAEARKCKLILLQPGLFKNGWLPFESKRAEFLNLYYSGLEVKLLYARTEGLQKISGMSMLDQISKYRSKRGFGLKPMLNAVPAGSVYYFEIVKPNSIKEIAEKLKLLDGSKIPNEIYSNMGFNQVAVGKIVE